MGAKTGIKWTQRTFNPWWGCRVISPGCQNCYAKTAASRYKPGPVLWGPGSTRLTFKQKHWDEPVKWNRLAGRAGIREKVFCGSMCDVFDDHASVHGERAKLWDLIKKTPNLDWLLLTKRPQNIVQFLPPDWGNGYENVWLGTTIEHMDFASRAKILRAIPAKVRFISYEPALGPLNRLSLAGIHWVIYGGESGPNRRPDNPAWAMSMYHRCKAAGVAFFFKQVSAFHPGKGTMRNGKVIRQFPAVKRLGRRKNTRVHAVATIPKFKLSPRVSKNMHAVSTARPLRLSLPVLVP